MSELVVRTHFAKDVPTVILAAGTNGRVVDATAEVSRDG